MWCVDPLSKTDLRIRNIFKSVGHLTAYDCLNRLPGLNRKQNRLLYLTIIWEERFMSCDFTLRRESDFEIRYSINLTDDKSWYRSSRHTWRTSANDRFHVNKLKWVEQHIAWLLKHTGLYMGRVRPRTRTARTSCGVPSWDLSQSIWPNTP